MKTVKLLLIVALVLAGVAVVALPIISTSFHTAQPAAPVMSIDETAPATNIACYPPPCDCSPYC